jgi:hypothetical protein
MDPRRRQPDERGLRDAHGRRATAATDSPAAASLGSQAGSWRRSTASPGARRAKPVRSFKEGAVTRPAATAGGPAQYRLGTTWPARKPPSTPFGRACASGISGRSTATFR